MEIRTALSAAKKALKPVVGWGNQMLNLADKRNRQKSDEASEVRFQNWATRVAVVFGDKSVTEFVKQYCTSCMTREGKDVAQARKSVMEFHAGDASLQDWERIEALLALIAGEFKDFLYLNGMEDRVRRWEKAKGP